MDKRNKRADNRRVYRGIVGIIVVAAVALVISFVDFRFIGDYLSGLGFKPSAEVTELENKLDLTDRGRVILRATYPNVEERESFNDNCKNVDLTVNVLGCYYDGKIFVFDVNNAELAGIKEVTLAHEVLHAIYERLSFREQDEVNKSLQQVYDGNENLQKRMENYSEDVRLNELHSVVGTEVLEIPQKLEEYYARYFQRRDKILGMFEDYDSKFTELKMHSDELATELEKMAAEINQQKTDYLDAADELNTWITDFNNRAEDGYFASEADFYAEREILTAEINRVSALYDEVNQVIDNYNTLVNEYNEISVHYDELANSIDSNFAPAPNI